MSSELELGYIHPVSLVDSPIESGTSLRKVSEWLAKKKNSGGTPST
jgi:hypothetical protein